MGEELKVGDVVEFITDSETAEWGGEPTRNRLSFHGGYKPSGFDPTIGRITGDGQFFYTAVFPHLHAPISAVRVLGDLGSVTHIPVEKWTAASPLSQLRRDFPHGHPRFLPLLMDEARLHSDKNHDYSKGGNPLGNFDRVSAILQLYPSFPYDTPAGVAILYALKQLDAILWGKAQRIQHKVEGLAGRYQDVSIYMKIARIADEEADV